MSFELILLIVAVIILVANSISSLNKGRKDWHELSGADRRSQELAEIKKRLGKLEADMQTVEERLTSGEENYKRIAADTGQIMNVLDGLLMHFISGNDKEKLKETKSELDHYKNSTRNQ